MRLKILVRFDDICPTMNFVEFKKAMELMDKNGVKPLIGVIPDCKDPYLQIEPDHSEFWDFIKMLQNKGYQVAMHGYQHVFDIHQHGIVEKRMESEFAGHTYDEQYQKIRKGKEILLSHGISTDIFFAPAHSYDKNTLKVLSDLGFKYLSDGKSNRPYMRYGLLLLPCRSGGCPRIGKKGMYTAVFHAHEWVRRDKKADFDSFVNLIKLHHNDIVSFPCYSSVDPSLSCIQIIIEKIYVYYAYNIKPILSYIFHKVLR